MSGELEFDAGFRVKKDGRVAFDSQTPAARLAPSEKLLLSNYDIEFPDFYKGIIWTLVNSRNIVTGTYAGGATSYIGLVGQDWGPGLAYDLPEIVLGAAPPGANYLNVRVKLTRTVTPAKIFGDIALGSIIRPDRWTRLAGSSCKLESQGPLRRTIDIVLDAGNIVLRRYQSVIDTAGTKERISQSVATGNGLFTYYHPGSPGTNAGYAPGHFAGVGEWLGNKSSGGSSASLAPGGSNGVVTNTALKSYRSVWTGDLEITPGRIG